MSPKERKKERRTGVLWLRRTMFHSGECSLSRFGCNPYIIHTFPLYLLPLGLPWVTYNSQRLRATVSSAAPLNISISHWEKLRVRILPTFTAYKRPKNPTNLFLGRKISCLTTSRLNKRNVYRMRIVSYNPRTWYHFWIPIKERLSY